jgi:hypothetical protein
MGSSECSQLLLVQPWISVCLHREKWPCATRSSYRSCFCDGNP